MRQSDVQSVVKMGNAAATGALPDPGTSDKDSPFQYDNIQDPSDHPASRLEPHHQLHVITRVTLRLRMERIGHLDRRREDSSDGGDARRKRVTWLCT